MGEIFRQNIADSYRLGLIELERHGLGLIELDATNEVYECHW